MGSDKAAMHFRPDYTKITAPSLAICADVDIPESPGKLDPETAAQTPFGGTIAHGFLSLSLLSRMAAEAMLLPDGLK